MHFNSLFQVASRHSPIDQSLKKECQAVVFVAISSICFSKSAQYSLSKSKTHQIFGLSWGK